METPLPKDLDAALTAVNGRLGEVNIELADAPRWKRMTSWWNDRCGERQRLLRERDRLVARKRELGK